jgi:hypothetical protein
LNCGPTLTAENQRKVIVMTTKTATTILVALLAVTLSGFSRALGAGFTFGANPYTGPYYSYNPPADQNRCVWRRQWIVDHHGRRILRRIQICSHG